MKKRKKLLIFLLELIMLGIFIICAYFPMFNQFAFIIRNLAIFVFLSVILIISVIFIMNRITQLLSRINHQLNVSYKKWITSVICAIGLYIISTVQLNNIKIKQTPYLTSCSYYDAYGNMLYSSTLFSNCSTAKVNQQTNQSLSLSFNESIKNKRGYIGNKSSEKAEYGKINATAMITLNVKYDDKNRITNYTINRLLKVTSFVGNQTYYIYQGTEKVLTNTYSQNQFISSQINYYKESLVSSQNALEQMTYPQYTENDVFNNEVMTVNYEKDSRFNSWNFTMTEDVTYRKSASTTYNLGTGTVKNNQVIGLQYIIHNDFHTKLYNENFGKLISTKGTVIWDSNYQKYEGLTILSKAMTSYSVKPIYSTYHQYTPLFSNNLEIEDNFYLWKIINKPYGYKVEKYDRYNNYKSLQSIGSMYAFNTFDYRIMHYLDYDEYLFNHSDLILQNNPILNDWIK